MSYQKYLVSKHWKLKRADCLSHRGEYCRVCWSNDNLHIHHMKYQIKGNSVFKNEPRYILIPLCSKCHKTFHNFYGSDVGLKLKHYHRANRLYLLGLSINDSIRFCSHSGAYSAAMYHLKHRV